MLTLAYMNAESLALTRETGEVHFCSRSREEIWRKGETSGNVLRAAPAPLRLRRRRDRRAGRAERARVPHGRAFVLPPRDRRRGTEPGSGEPAATHEALAALERTLAERRRERPEGSYTVELLADPERIGAKVREEADEVARAAARRVGRARGRGGGRRPLPPRGPAALARRAAARTRWRYSMAVAAEPTRVVPVVERFIDDRRPRSAAFLKLRAAFVGPRLPARVGGAGQARPLLVPRLLAAPEPELGACRRRAIPTGSPPSSWTPTTSSRWRTRRRSPAGRWASSATTSYARSSRWATRTPIRSACRTWR